MILIAAPARSGTRRLCFEILGTEQRGMVPLRERHRATRHEFLHTFLYDGDMPSVIECANEGMMIITTSRPEAAVRASWIRNGMDLNELESVLANWRRLMELNPYVMQLGRHDGKVYP